jgi:hypothetical protein
LLIEKFLQTWRVGSTVYVKGLQWTKLGRGATLQCNVDRLRGGSLTVEIRRSNQSKTNQESIPWICICAARKS